MEDGKCMTVRNYRAHENILWQALCSAARRGTVTLVPYDVAYIETWRGDF